MSIRRRIQRAWSALTKPDKRGITSPYDGADINRLLADWVTLKMHPDDESRFNIERLRVRARDLERNSPLARNFLRLVAVNVIGPRGIGFSAQVKNNSDKPNVWINERIEDSWDEWSQRPTLDGKLDLATFSRLAIKTIARDGEMFIRKWRGAPNDFGFAIEAIDPDQVDHLFTRAGTATANEIRMGVEVDAFSKPVAYWMWDKPERTFTNLEPRNRIRVPAEEIIHLYDPDRVNQTRGITWFAPVMVSLRMLEAYREAELVAARIGAAAMGFFERVPGEGGAPPVDEDEQGKFSMETPEAGTFGVLPEGYRLATFHPQHPSTAFPAFVKDAIRGIATGLGVSYNGLTSDLESVNYSSMRSGLLIERELWKTLQQWWISQFLQPLYADWLAATLTNGSVKLDSRIASKFLSVRWSPRGWSWVDPLKDTEAAVMGIQTGLMSRTQAMAEQGLDFDETLEDLAAETAAAITAKVDIAGPVAGASGKPKVDKPVADGATPGTDPEATGPEADSGGRNGNGHTNRLAQVLNASRERQRRWRSAGHTEGW